VRKPVVDYRKFRLSEIHKPEYSHLKLLLGWVGYFTLYFLTENLIPAENCYSVHSVLDDLIPFYEGFLIPYVFWYALIVISLGYFLLYHVDSFKRLQTYIIITQVVAMAAYILFPTRQDLRPEVFPRENFATWILGILYAFDTNTGVFPSLHVGYSLGIASTWLREKSAPKWVRIAIAVWCGVICVSVAFVKQHSVADIFAALPMGLFAEWFVFSERRNRKKTNHDEELAAV